MQRLRQYKQEAPVLRGTYCNKEMGCTTALIEEVAKGLLADRTPAALTQHMQHKNHSCTSVTDPSGGGIGANCRQAGLPVAGVAELQSSDAARTKRRSNACRAEAPHRRADNSEVIVGKWVPNLVPKA
eukprot:3579863-Pleurochrysis_carterae.AAC.2